MGVLVGTVLLVTVLFDLVDIRPSIGSFAFVRTGTYLVYLLLRLFLAFAAALLIAAAQPGQPPIIVGFTAVIGGVVVLQGFALKIAGQDVVNLANLIQTYKGKMIDEAADHAVLALDAHILKLTNELLQLAPDESWLRSELQSVLLKAYERAVDRVAQRFQEIEARAAGDADFKRRIYAAEIVQTNPVFARDIVERLRRQQRSGPGS